MSGHMTRMSRGSRPGSRSSRSASTSRSTSTWRDCPWQAWTCTLRSVAGTCRPSRVVPSGGLSDRMSCWSIASSLVGPSPGVPAAAPGAPASPRLSPDAPVPLPADPASSSRPPATASVRCSSRASRPRLASSGCRTSSPDRSSSRGTGPTATTGASSSHATGEACGSHRWTSRCSARAPITSTSLREMRVCPNRDSRPGSSRSVRRPSRSASTTRACRSSGASAPTTSSTRRHSGGCQARSSATRPPRPSPSPPARQSVSTAGRCAA